MEQKHAHGSTPLAREPMTYPKMKDPTRPLDPPPEYTALQAEQPIARVKLPSGRTTWLITGHEAARQLLSHPNTSVDRTHPNLPYAVPNPEAVLAQQARWVRILLGDDPPLHTTRRRMLISEFSVRRAQAMRPYIQQIVDAQIDELIAAGSPADLVKHVALSVPSLVICDLLGVPYEDHEFFQARTALQMERNVSPQEQKKAIDELLGYFEALISKKEKAPADDLLSRLIVNNRETEAFDHESLVALGVLLLIGGHETTSNTIALGTAWTLNNAEQFTQLKAEPSLMPSAVEEFLRFFSVALSLTRIATADIELCGETIKSGEGAIISLSTAARDATVFSDPDTLDIERNTRNHLAFSHGIHQCLGMNIARVELEIVFNTLFRRLPGLRLATPFHELPFKFQGMAFGLYELPVAW